MMMMIAGVVSEKGDLSPLSNFILELYMDDPLAHTTPPLINIMVSFLP